MLGLSCSGNLTVALQDGYGGYLSGVDAGSCLERLNSFRVLSPVRQGGYGVGEINSIAEKALGVGPVRSALSQWYPFRPVMMTRNDYQLGLSNGDVGVALPEEDGTLSAWFPAAEGAYRSFSPLSLQSCDTVFAMTVHKSQGSEFDSLLILLPPAFGEILTRELLYTAITRGRKKVEIWGSTDTFISAAERRIQRSSGLRQRLWAQVGPDC